MRDASRSDRFTFPVNIKQDTAGRQLLIRHKFLHPSPPHWEWSYRQTEGFIVCVYVLLLPCFLISRHDLYLVLSALTFGLISLLATNTAVSLSSYHLRLVQYTNINSTNQKLQRPVRSQSFLIFLDHPKAIV